MLKKYRRFFLSLEIIRDASVVGLAFVLAYIVRFYTIFPYETISNWHDTVFMFALSSITWPLMAWGSGLYRSWRSRSFFAEMFALSKVTILAAAVIIVLTYFIRDIKYSRGVLIAFTALSFTCVMLSRLVSRFLLRSLRERGYNLRRVLVVGDGFASKRIIQLVDQNPDLGMRVEGVVTTDEEQHCEEIEGVPVVGKLPQLHERVCEEPMIDQVFVALPIDKLALLRSIMSILSNATVDVRLIPDIYEFMTLRGSVEEFAGLPIIDLQASPMQGWSQVGKRAFDLVFGSFCLLAATPIMLASALLIKLSSPGPIIYRQVRMGMDGQLFDILKFRTMRLDAEVSGPKMADKIDKRVTRIGSLLRKTSMDELPQLINVIKGDMSLVGPRPERPCFIEEFRHQIPRYYLRHKIKAGLTGLAQINGYRGGNTSIAKRIEYDLFYIEKWSLLLDFKILVQTIFGGLFKNAY